MDAIEQGSGGLRSRVRLGAGGTARVVVTAAALLMTLGCGGAEPTAAQARQACKAAEDADIGGGSSQISDLIGELSAVGVGEAERFASDLREAPTEAAQIALIDDVVDWCSDFPDGNPAYSGSADEHEVTKDQARAACKLTDDVNLGRVDRIAGYDQLIAELESLGTNETDELASDLRSYGWESDTGLDEMVRWCNTFPGGNPSYTR